MRKQRQRIPNVCRIAEQFVNIHKRRNCHENGFGVFYIFSKFLLVFSFFGCIMKLHCTTKEVSHMQFGHFDDAKKEYVITSPKTPLPWINYLGSENFFSLISNTCGGYSFYKDAKLLRLTRYRYNDTPLDQNGRYYYIKDGDTVWNPGWQPT